MPPLSVPVEQILTTTPGGVLDRPSGLGLSAELADGALPVTVAVADQDGFLASVEARLANEVDDLVSALVKFSRSAQAISEELPLSAHFGKNVTLFLSLASCHVANALLQGRDKPLLLDDGALQLREMGLSLKEFLRELDLDGRRFLAVALVDQQAHHLRQRGEGSEPG